MARKPNIIFTIADDQRFDTIEALGNHELRTPALNRLAQRGTCFTRARIPGSTHGAICAPSRAQLHTGRMLFDVADNMDRTDAPSMQRRPSGLAAATLGEILQRAGYTTFGTGKWHNQEPSFRRSFRHGRRVFYGGMSSHYCVPQVGYDPDTSHEAHGEGINGHSTDRFAEAAVDFLNDYDGDEPFFCYCAFTAPHDPRETHWSWHKQYPRESVALPPNFKDMPDERLNVRNMRDELLGEFPRDPEDVRRHIADYYAMIAHMDDAIGRIHDALEARGELDNTIIVHTADHGLGVGQHGLIGKQNLYDHSIRVPLQVAGPGFDADATDDRLCYMQDLFPTLLESLGLDTPDDCDFRSLHSSDKRTTLGTAYDKHIRCIRDERMKLITYPEQPAGNDRELFDTQTDTWEMTNLATATEDHEAIPRLEAALRDWQQSVHDPILR